VCLVGNLDAFLRHMVIAVPLSEVVAVVDVAAEHQEPCAEWLSAFEALALLVAGIRLWLVLEHFQLVLEVLIKEVLRVLEVSGLFVERQLWGLRGGLVFLGDKLFGALRGDFVG
jgi:hypothetical protein